MANGQLDTVMRYLRRIAGPRENGGLTDTQLLERVVTSHDQAAFEVLVWRHGPIVMGVCRRVLRHTQDAEDAFQATFLTLARKAGSLGKREALASWLYKVAYRIALRAKAVASKRAAHEQQDVDLAALQASSEQRDAVACRELRVALDEELSQLPEKYRAPLVLCYLQGKTHAQAAKEMGCPLGSMSRHLVRAQELLCRRLAGRGVVLSASLLGAALAREAAAAAVSATSVLPAVQAALVFAAGTAAAAGETSAKAAALAEAAIKAMWVNKLKISAALVLGLTLTGAGAGVATYHVFPSKQPEVEHAEKPKRGDIGMPIRPVRANSPPSDQLYVYFTIHAGGNAILAPRPDLLEVRVDLDLERVPLREAFQRTFQQAKQEYAIDGNLPEDRQITLRGKALLLSEVLDQLTRPVGRGWMQEVTDDKPLIRVGQDFSFMTTRVSATPEFLRQVDSLKPDPSRP
jgi:RNA polymerase sigma factor (sigma-70 family)